MHSDFQGALGIYSKSTVVTLLQVLTVPVTAPARFISIKICIARAVTTGTHRVIVLSHGSISVHIVVKNLLRTSTHGLSILRSSSQAAVKSIPSRVRMRMTVRHSRAELRCSLYVSAR